MSEGKIIEDIAQVAVGGASVGGGFVGFRWLMNWLTQWSEKRAARLDAQEERADLEWKEIRQALKDQLADALRRVEKVEVQNLALRRAFNHVAGALLRHDPKHPALMEADQIMAAAFPTDFELAVSRAEAALDRASRSTN